MCVGCIIFRYPMSLISSTSNSSASVALRLLTDAAVRQSSPTTGTQPKSVVGTLHSASTKAASPSSDTKIILSAKAAIDYFGAGSEIARAVAGLGDTVEVQTSGLDVPEDKAAFRQQVLDYFKDYYANNKPLDTDQAAFAEALKAGKVNVKTVDEAPELNWKPDVGWAVYRDGYPQGGGIKSEPIGNQKLFDDMSATRGQAVGSIGSHYYYAYFEK